MWKALKNRFNSTDSLISLALGLAVVLVVGMTVINYIKAKGQPASSTAKEEAAKQGATALPATHKVTQGESLWTISEKYYKSGYNWEDIQKANSLMNPDRIEEDQSLTIPNVTPIMPQGEISAATTDGKPKEKTYAVVMGDDLWDIAVKIYDNGYKWVDIARANALTNPDIIHAGNVLTLPE